MMTQAQQQPGPEGPDALPSLDDEGDRPSITEVNGTVARFEMAYQPEAPFRQAFGAPLLQHVPAIVWFVFTLVLTGVVVAAHHMSSNSTLYAWIVERDRGGIPAAALAFVVLASGIATLARSYMRGVIVHAGGLEARYILPLGMPRVRKWAWAQIHRMVLSDDGVMLELWTNEYEKLPPVGKPGDLGALLEHMGAMHGIIVTKLDRPR
jgi:hypothetical protein